MLKSGSKLKSITFISRLIFFLRVVGPKQAKLDEAVESLKEKQAQLAEAQQRLAEINMTLQKLQKEYEEKLVQKEELNRKVGYSCNHRIKNYGRCKKVFKIS